MRRSKLAIPPRYALHLGLVLVALLLSGSRAGVSMPVQDGRVLAPEPVFSPATPGVVDLSGGARMVDGEAGSPYAPSSLSCSVNVACAESAAWEAEISATVRILIGSVPCTGVLVNNTRQDRRPYVLTAHHCGHPEAGQTVDWTFQFNYQSATCADPVLTPEAVTLRGAVVRAAQGGAADFALLELLDPIPAAAPVHFAGWSIDEHVPERSIVISHPRGDIKKITYDDDPLTDEGTVWHGAFDRGSLEVGSSGAPLFDENHRLVGYVRSAVAIDHHACSGPGGDDNAAEILFPKLSYIWAMGVSDVLDPDGTGKTSLAALSPQSTLWINEINADASDGAEFIELAAAAGTDLDGFSIDVYACQGGEASLLGTQPLQPFTFADQHEGIGFFVLGDVALQADQRFGQAAHAHGLLPDGSGLVVLRDEHGNEIFAYPYEAAYAGSRQIPPSCPADRLQRSTIDPPGAGTMGFLTTEAPDGTMPGLATLDATPGAANIEASHVLAADHDGVPNATFTLSAAYPNPFTTATQVILSVDRPQQVAVAVYDVTGRRVAYLFEGRISSPAPHTFAFEAAHLPDGLYVMRITGEHFATSRTVVLLR